MIDRHDAARYMIDRAGGLRRYLPEEAKRIIARFVKRLV
jgi:hypothetical protein